MDWRRHAPLDSILSGINLQRSVIKIRLDFVSDIEQQFAEEAEERSDLSVADRFQELYEQWITLALLNFAEWVDGNIESASLMLKKRGFKDILPDKKIRLNCTMERMDYLAEGVTVYLQNGEMHHYAHVIITCALGFMKKNHSTFFSPPLPATKINAITYLDACCMGIVSGDGPSVVSGLEDEELVVGVTQHLREALDDVTIPQPIGIFRHNWIKDPLIGGSYSYLTLETVQHVPDAFTTMAEPITIISKPILCFAGEHTHPIMYQTTIGAYESGEREAQRILDYLMAGKVS